MRSRSTLPYGSMLAAWLLSGCLFSEGGRSKDPVNGIDAGPYRVENDRIIIGPHITTFGYCAGDSLISESDTASAATLEFKLMGNSLTLSRMDTTDAGVIIRQNLILSRSGAGSGLEGVWLATDAAYEVKAGALGASEKDSLDNEVSDRRVDMLRSGYNIILSGGRISYWYDVNRAQLFIDVWNGKGAKASLYPDSALYDIELTALDKTHVRLNGRKNGEVVDIGISSQGDKTFSSNHPDHKPQTVYSNARTCPNGPPDWYLEFRLANAKSIAP